MRISYILVFTAAFLVLAGLNLISCENRARSGKTETPERQVEKPGAGMADEKKPTLDQIVEYQNETKAKLENMDKRIEELKVEIQESGAKKGLAINKQIKELDWKKEYAFKKFQELQSTSQVAWNEVRFEMEALMDDLERSYEKAISEFKEERATGLGVEPKSGPASAAEGETEAAAQ